MNPSIIREILKVIECPGIISFAGDLPSSKTFPVAEFEAACAKVLRDDPHGAQQYATSEGFGPLCTMVTKVLIDAGSRILVEVPTYLGAVMAFAPMEPEIVSVANDTHGISTWPTCTAPASTSA
jgi:2-aminoadipate transaminase